MHLTASLGGHDLLLVLLHSQSWTADLTQVSLGFYSNVLICLGGEFGG